MWEKVMITQLKQVILVPGSEIGRHVYSGTLTCCELVYKLEGYNTTWFGGCPLENAPGTLEFLPSGIPDNEYYVEVTEPGCCLNVHFQMAEPFPKKAMIWNTEERDVFRSLFRRLHRHWLLREEGALNKCMADLYLIFAEMAQLTNVYQPSVCTDKLRPGLEYLEKHCFNPSFRYAHLAECCGMSYSYFKRLFQRKYRMPPSRYLTQLRMDAACELLINSNESVSQIAERLGYESVYYFSKVFHREVGCPPSSYRRQMDR